MRTRSTIDRALFQRNGQGYESQHTVSIEPWFRGGKVLDMATREVVEIRLKPIKPT